MNNNYGFVFLEIEDGIEYVKIRSPGGEVLCKVIFHIDDKYEIIHIVMKTIQEFVDQYFPGETIEFRFSDEYIRIFAGVDIKIVKEYKSNPLTIIMLIGMIAYELITLTF